MKISRYLSIILFGACLIHSLAMATDAQPANTNADKLPSTEVNLASKDDLSAQKELFQLQLDAKKELLQKDIEAQAERIESFERRIDDQTNRISDIGAGVDRFGLIIGSLSILITILLVGLGFLGYKTAKSDARDTATEAAEQAAAKWFETHHKNLISRMEELESRVTQANERIDDHEEKVAQRSDAFNAKVDASEKTLEDQMDSFQRRLSQSATVGKSEKQPPQDNSAIEQKAEQLKQKPESEYTFSDWNTRAFAAYSEGKFEDAIFYWDKSVATPDIKPRDRAKALLNKGHTLGQLNRVEDAITVYGLIISDYRNTEELNLREMVAKAMLNSGVALGQINRIDEEMEFYNLIINQFGMSVELSLLEQVSKAMVNKAIALNQLNQNQEEIAVYDEVIIQFGTTEDPRLLEQVATAFNNKGFTLLCMAKANWSNAELAKELLADANNAFSSALSKNSDGVIHGNLAYITWLRGDAVAAAQYFRAGLASPVSGGERLYKSTLTDFDIHPIEPDKGFRELVEKLWAEYQQSNKS